MKKTYKTPEVALWHIGTTTIIAESDPNPGVNPGTPADPNDPVLVKGRGRGGDVWADDWSK